MTNELFALLRKLVNRAHWTSEEEAKEASELVDKLDSPDRQIATEPTEQNE